MNRRRVYFRLNPAVPQERAILAHLEQLAAGRWGAEMKRLLYRALVRSVPPPPGEASTPPGTRAERRAAFQPPASPKPAYAAELLGLLSPGEARVLTALAWHPYLSTSDLAVWLGCSPSFTRRTLDFLEAKGAARAWPKAVQPWPRATYYTLTDFGVLLLAIQERESLSAMKHRLGVGPRQWGYLTHTVEANRFFLALNARRDAGRLAIWRSEGESRVTFPMTGRPRGGVLRPDGYGEWVVGSWRYPFFLEWDRHTDNPRKLRDKLQLYLKYYGYLQQAEAEQALPRLLFVAADSNGATAVLKLSKLQGSQQPYYSLPVWVTDRQAIWQQGPLAEVWRPLSGGPQTGPWEEPPNT
jgi:DNA-binding MarR family transcriptional regulator